MTDKDKYVFEKIFARRSIRRFIAGKQVEKWKVIKLLEAAMAARRGCRAMRGSAAQRGCCVLHCGFR